MSTLEIATVGSLEADDLFIEVDDDKLTTNEEVNAFYNADEIEGGFYANRVKEFRNVHVDIVDLVIVNPFGEEQIFHRVETGLFVWRIKK